MAAAHNLIKAARAKTITKIIRGIWCLAQIVQVLKTLRGQDDNEEFFAVFISFFFMLM